MKGAIAFMSVQSGIIFPLNFMQASAHSWPSKLMVNIFLHCAQFLMQTPKIFIKILLKPSCSREKKLFKPTDNGIGIDNVEHGKTHEINLQNHLDRKCHF